jgi:exonuclease III
MINNINIACWNIDGLYQTINTHRYCKTEYPEFLREISNIDILFLLETHCGVKDYPQIPGYKTNCNYRKKLAKAFKASGGICVAIKETIADGVSVLEKFSSEILWLKLNKNFFGFTNDIYVGAVYVSPPGTSYTARREDIFSLCEQKLAEYSKLGDCIICGDFNSRTNLDADYVSCDVNDRHFRYNLENYDDNYIEDVPMSRRNMDEHKRDAYGEKLLDICKSTNLRLLNGRFLGDFKGRPTCYSPAGAPSVIDYFAAHVSLLHKVKLFRVHDVTPLSIHCMITTTLYTGNISITSNDVPLSPKYKTYAWSSDCISKFQNGLCSQECQLLIDKFMTRKFHVEINDVNIAVNDVNDILHCAASIGGIRHKGTQWKRKRKKRNKKWYDKDCRGLYRDLKKLGHKLCLSPYDINLQRSYHTRKKEYKKLLRKKKQKYHANLINLLSEAEENNPKAFWEVYDKFSELESVHKENPIPAGEWLNHFKNLLGNINPTANPAFEKDISDYIEINKDHIFNELNYKIKVDEVYSAISHLKNGKSSGIDSIKAEMLKAGTSQISKVLTKLFNFVFSSGCFPELWRESTITAIHKKGDHHNTENYRGIAVGSTMCKVFCNILQKRLVQHLDSKNILPPNQIGYRKNHRTVDHVLVLKTLIDKYIMQQNRKYLYVCFVDLKSAFDTVWREAMIYKLLKNGIDGLFLNIIKDMYKSVNMRVKMDGGLTELFKSNSGVKQGCVLSPTLFNVFLYDIPEIFGHDCDPVTLYEDSLSCLLFADMILFSESANGLQNCLNKLLKYCSKWKLTVNIAKTKIIIFNKGGHKLSKYKFNYGSGPVEVVQNHIYLGIVFNASGSFRQAMFNLNDKAKKSYHGLLRKLPDCSVKLAIKMFHIIVQPVLSYGCEIWSPTVLTSLLMRITLLNCVIKLRGKKLI